MSIHLLLASQSPRRRAMITWLNIPVRTSSAHIQEQPHPQEVPATMATRLAQSKAHNVQAQSGEWILAADTVVDLDEVPLGKPQTPTQAHAMLKDLRARPHLVHTGIALVNPASHQRLTIRVTTEVHMRHYTDAEIERYVASRDPMDKAGAYAIQHPEFAPVASVNRCYANVVGLPLCAVTAALTMWGATISAPIPARCRAHFSYECPAIDEGTLL